MVWCKTGCLNCSKVSFESMAINSVPENTEIFKPSLLEPLNVVCGLCCRHKWVYNRFSPSIFLMTSQWPISYTNDYFFVSWLSGRWADFSVFFGAPIFSSGMPNHQVPQKPIYFILFCVLVCHALRGLLVTYFMIFPNFRNHPQGLTARLPCLATLKTSIMIFPSLRLCNESSLIISWCACTLWWPIKFNITTSTTVLRCNKCPILSEFHPWLSLAAQIWTYLNPQT